MDYVAQLRFSDVVAFQHFRDAPVGSLLQTSISGQLAICLKAEMQSPGGNFYLALVVAGDTCGLLLFDDVVIGTCIDLSNHAVFVASNPALVPVPGAPLQVGSVFKSTTQDAWFMWTACSTSGRQPTTQWVCIADDGHSNQRGTIHSSLNRSNLTGIALRSDIQLKKVIAEAP